jgi:aryl-alcohol dehydrogenase-like predicted oxidoreductase
MGILPWSPLKSALLSGAYTRDQPTPAGTNRGGAFGIRPAEPQFTVIDAVTAIARQTGATPAAVAWPGFSSDRASPRP